MARKLVREYGSTADPNAVSAAIKEAEAVILRLRELGGAEEVHREEKWKRRHCQRA